MKASSESGLWAMEISSNAGETTPEVFVLTAGNNPFGGNGRSRNGYNVWMRTGAEANIDAIYALR
jgi:hypothetical protein